MAVSGVVSPVLGFRTNGLAVVEPLREDERLSADSGTEGSDCGGGPEQASESALEEDVDGKRESERESLPVLTIGSFARYARHSMLVELEVLTLSVAGDRCSSICARTRYSLHRSDLKARMCVRNTYKDRQRWTSLPVHLKQYIPLHPW